MIVLISIMFMEIMYFHHLDTMVLPVGIRCTHYILENYKETKDCENKLVIKAMK
jgi:hypothetical protein